MKDKLFMLVRVIGSLIATENIQKKENVIFLGQKIEMSSHRHTDRSLFGQIEFRSDLKFTSDEPVKRKISKFLKEKYLRKSLDEIKPLFELLSLWQSQGKVMTLQIEVIKKGKGFMLTLLRNQDVAIIYNSTRFSDWDFDIGVRFPAPFFVEKMIKNSPLTGVAKDSYQLKVFQDETAVDDANHEYGVRYLPAEVHCLINDFLREMNPRVKSALELYREAGLIR